MKMSKSKCGASNPATQKSTPKMNMGGMMMGKAKSKPRYAPGNAGKKRPAKPKGIMV
tara:strand:- start:286 stop:456 length:171 start_codon:yes stop_codon:yes gene_type:complete